MGWSPGEVTTREGMTVSVEGSSGLVEVMIVRPGQPDEYLHLTLEDAESLSTYLKFAVAYVRGEVG